MFKVDVIEQYNDIIVETVHNDTGTVISVSSSVDIEEVDMFMSLVECMEYYDKPMTFITLIKYDILDIVENIDSCFRGSGTLSFSVSFKRMDDRQIYSIDISFPPSYTSLVPDIERIGVSIVLDIKDLIDTALYNYLYDTDHTYTMSNFVSTMRDFALHE